MIPAFYFHGIQVAQFTPDLFRGNPFICISMGIFSSTNNYLITCKKTFKWLICSGFIFIFHRNMHGNAGSFAWCTGNINCAI